MSSSTKSMRRASRWSRPSSWSAASGVSSWATTGAGAAAGWGGATGAAAGAAGASPARRRRARRASSRSPSTEKNRPKASDSLPANEMFGSVMRIKLHWARLSGGLSCRTQDERRAGHRASCSGISSLSPTGAKPVFCLDLMSSRPRRDGRPSFSAISRRRMTGGAPRAALHRRARNAAISRGAFARCRAGGARVSRAPPATALPRARRSRFIRCSGDPFHRETAELAEAHGQRLAERRVDRARVRAGRHDLAGANRFAARREEIHEPAQRLERMPVRVAAVEHAVHAAPTLERDRLERRTQAAAHDRADAQPLIELIVREQFRHGGARRVRIAAAEHLEHEADLADGGAHLALVVRPRARRQVAIEHEGDFRFDPNGPRVGDDGERAARRTDRRCEDRRDDDPARRRKRAFPAADRLAEPLGDAALDRERRLDVVGPTRGGQKRAGDAGPAGRHQVARGGVDTFGETGHVAFEM
ncbi:hypothetical protein BURPS1710b_A0043 [Burkholderia pseudomallei 1710b]|uniref:Uncharacterized protein n=1 Tax=Burkholderia pseudomallei (strain 1710b) TaxID=320372 RepID=Q3JMK1_BURP1|nr:hypothetical protein BURPS1710b_A0043 [Burkholderia pseudomallei 1710b]